MGRKQLAAAGKVALILVIAVLLQVLITSRITVLGVTADLFVIMTVIIAVTKGSLSGAVFGFFAGLLADISFSQPLGVHALIYLLVGWLVGMFVDRFALVGPWAVVLVTGAASFGAQLVFGLFQFLIGPRAAFVNMIGWQMVPEAILDALFAAPIYWALVRTRLLPAGVEPTPARSNGQ
jgi:rod shape-determining protein MreD